MANNDILQALNAIEAQLAAFEFDDGQTTQPVGDLLNAIQANIEALRTTYETRSVAETVAQNTNFDDLIAALAQLRFICNQRVSISNFLIADIPPSGDGIQGTDPPPPFTDPDQTPGTQEFANRKCKISNAIHFGMRDNFELWNNWLLDEAVNLSFVTLTTAITIAIGELLATWPLLASMVHTVGLLDNIALYTWSNIDGLEFGDIVTAMNANESDLICALYESGSASEARGNYNAVLDAAGLSVTNRGVVVLFLEDSIVNYLFFKGEEDIEAWYPTYTPPNDCSACAGTCENRNTNGENFVDTGTQMSADSTPGGGGNMVSVHIDTTEALEHCGGTVTVSNFVTTAGNLDNSGESVGAYRLYSAENPPTSGSNGDLYNSNVPPPDPISGVAYIVLKSTSTFSVQMDYVVD